MNTGKRLLGLAAGAALFASTAVAQVIFSGANSARGIEDQEDVSTCQTSGGATRIRSNCEPDTTTERTEHRITLPSIKLDPLLSAQCAATAATEYFQQQATAHVASTISIQDCTAASGELTFALRIRDANGNVSPLEFNETWQRSGDGDVKLTADYGIGENVSLVSVRVRNLRCTCADAPAEQAAE